MNLHTILYCSLRIFAMANMGTKRGHHVMVASTRANSSVSHELTVLVHDIKPSPPSHCAYILMVNKVCD